MCLTAFASLAAVPAAAMTMRTYGLAPNCANLTTGMISYSRPRCHRRIEQADKSVDALVQAVAADKPEVVVDLGDISRRLHELAENLKLIIDGTDEHYVYSLQVNRRLRAGGESMTAERIDIGEALATSGCPRSRLSLHRRP